MKSFGVRNGVRPTITTAEEGTIALVAGDKGAIFYNTDTNLLRTWDGTAFQDVGGGSSGGAIIKNFELTDTATAGHVVQLTNNGKVEPISGTLAEMSGLQTTNSPDNSQMDPFNSDKFAAMTGNQIVIGYISGKTVSYDLPVTYATRVGGMVYSSHQIRWNPYKENSLVIFSKINYNSGTEYWCEIMPCMVSGGSVTFGTNSVLSPSNNTHSIADYEAQFINTNVFVLTLEIPSAGSNKSAAFTVQASGLSIVTLTSLTLVYAIKQIASDPFTEGRFSCTYGVSSTQRIIVYQLTGTSLTSGNGEVIAGIWWSATMFSSDVVGKVLALSSDTNSGPFSLRSYSVDGVTIVRETTITWPGKGRQHFLKQDPNDSSKFLMAFVEQHPVDSWSVRVREGTWTTEYDFTVSEELYSIAGFVNGLSFDQQSKTNKALISLDNAVTVVTYPGTNLDEITQKFILQESGIATEIKPCLISGIDATQTGIIPNTIYYSNDIGALATTPTYPNVKIGVGISSTEVHIEGAPGLTAAVGIAELKDELAGDVLLPTGDNVIDFKAQIHYDKVLDSVWAPTFENPVKGKSIVIIAAGDNAAYTLTVPASVKGDISAFDGTLTNQLTLYCLDDVTPVYSIDIKTW